MTPCWSKDCQREFVNMLLQQADSAWLYIEFIVCFGPSRISCLVKGWNCSLGDLSDRQSLRFHGWCGWQTSCWESLLGQSSPHLPKRLRCKALHVLGAPSCDSLTSFPEKTLESIWCEQEHGPISSLPELKVSFPHVSWCVLETLFEAKRTIDGAVTALTSFQVPSSTILAHAIPWAHSTHSKRACHQRSHPWSEDMSSKKDDD